MKTGQHNVPQYSALVCLIAGILLVGCSGVSQSETGPCSTLIPNSYQLEIYFGRSVPGSEKAVSDTAFDAFTDQHITALWPQGFTLLEGTGSWRSDDGTIGKERVTILKVISEKDNPSDQAIHKLAETYRQMFNQEAVLIATSPLAARLCFGK